jgi:hypothetical protein
VLSRIGPVVASLLVLVAPILAAPRLRAQTVVVSGDPAALTVRSATAGLEPDPASDATTTYAVTTTGANQKIVARLDAPLPVGVTLTMQCTAPPGAASRGQVALSTLDQELVGPIPTPGTYAGLAIVYTHRATVKAGPVPMTARVVTISIIAGP